MNLAFNRMKAENGGNAPKLHPILAALSIVLSWDENLSKITASHPRLRKHIHYDPSVVFPSEISDLLPKQEKRWWDVIPINPRQVDSPPPPIPAGGSLILLETLRFLLAAPHFLLATLLLSWENLHMPRDLGTLCPKKRMSRCLRILPCPSLSSKLRPWRLKTTKKKKKTNLRKKRTC